MFPFDNPFITKRWNNTVKLELNRFKLVLGNATFDI